MRSGGNIIAIFEAFHNVFEKMVVGPTTRTAGMCACVRADGVRLTVLSLEGGGGGPGTREVLKVFVPLHSANTGLKVLQHVYGLALLISQQLNTCRESQLLIHVLLLKGACVRFIDYKVRKQIQSSGQFMFTVVFPRLAQVNGCVWQIKDLYL